MAPVKIDTQACITVDEVATAISRCSGSPTDQKTRAYSPVSPARGTSRDKPPSSRSSGFRSPSPEQLVHGMTHRYPSHQSSASASASGTATAGSSSSRGGTGEDTLTLRRREANRLAAQRFRSRKKGYQDSLEEKIRILEEEKDSMARRLDPNHRRSPPEYNRHDPYRRRSVSPDRHIDADVRVASLESANRRLQDELRGVVEENERLRDEVDRWRRWELEMRDQRSTEDRYMRGMPSLPPLEAKAMAPPSYPPTSPYDSSYAAHAPRHPPLERGQSWAAASPHRLPSPGPRLPPLRLAPAGSAPAVETSRPLLPRPESMERLSHSGGLPRSLP